MAESGMVQLGKGAVSRKSLRAMSQDAAILRMEYDRETTTHLVPGQGWVAFTYPLSWSGDYTLNGRHASPGDIALFTPRLGYVSQGKDVISCGAGFKTDRLINEISALSGQDTDESQLTDDFLDLKSASGIDVQRRINRVLSFCLDQELRGDHYGMPEVAENALYEIAAQAVLAQSVFSPESGHKRRSDLAIVRRAVEIANDIETPVTLSDLCRAAGVGHTRLSESFASIHGVSPIQYIKRMRLEKAKDRLLDPYNPPNSIKDVSLQFGFMNGGRFSGDYRSLFGEAPHETLKRSQRILRSDN